MCTSIECFYNNNTVTSPILFLQKSYWSMFLQFLINKSEKASDGEGLVKEVHACGFGYDQLFHKHQLNI